MLCPNFPARDDVTDLRLTTNETIGLVLNIITVVPMQYPVTISTGFHSQAAIEIVIAIVKIPWGQDEHSAINKRSR